MYGKPTKLSVLTPTCRTVASSTFRLVFSAFFSMAEHSVTRSYYNTP